MQDLTHLGRFDPQRYVRFLLILLDEKAAPVDRKIEKIRSGQSLITDLVFSLSPNLVCSSTIVFSLVD